MLGNARLELLHPSDYLIDLLAHEGLMLIELVNFQLRGAKEDLLSSLCVVKVFRHLLDYWLKLVSQRGLLAEASICAT